MFFIRDDNGSKDLETHKEEMEMSKKVVADLMREDKDGS